MRHDLDPASTAKLREFADADPQAHLPTLDEPIDTVTQLDRIALFDKNRLDDDTDVWIQADEADTKTMHYPGLPSSNEVDTQSGE